MATREVSGSTVGFVVFAGVMLMLIGTFHAFTGLAAIIQNEFFVVGRNYAYELDVTAWGWLHLIFGVIVAAAGYGVFSGATWARVVGITLAVISAIGNFFFIPYQPVWAILIIALDVLVIAALTAYSPRSSAMGA
jgi:hypothetical protein